MFRNNSLSIGLLEKEGGGPAQLPESTPKGPLEAIADLQPHRLVQRGGGLRTIVVDEGTGKIYYRANDNEVWVYDPSEEK